MRDADLLKALRLIVREEIANANHSVLIPVRELVLPPPVIEGGFVYFAQVQNADGFIKIGRAKDLSRRRTNYRTSSPYNVEYVAFYYASDPGAHERMIHKRFGDVRVSGEWFRPTPDLLAFLAEMQNAHAANWLESVP